MVIEETAVDKKDQYALDERGSSSRPQPARAGDCADGGLAPAPGSTNAQATEDRQIGTLSEPDKVTDAGAPSWTKFSDLSIDQKFEQAKEMGFELRDVYLRERCRAAKMELACAASALNRATEIIETNLPFFLVHFEEMDAQGKRSDLQGKVVGKTEWLRQNMPDLSKGTFYAALNAVKTRYAEQERLMLGGVSPRSNTLNAPLTETQSAVVQALVGQGYKNEDAVSMVNAAEGEDFDSLFRSALAHRGEGVGTGTPFPGDPPEPTVNEVGTKILRSSESKVWGEGLPFLVEDRNQLNPTIRERLIRALRTQGKKLLATADELERDFQPLPTDTGMCHQKLVALRLEGNPE